MMNAPTSARSFDAPPPPFRHHSQQHQHRRAQYSNVDGMPLSPQHMRTRVCRHFLNGRCTWGESCRFAHEPPFYPAPDGMPVVRVGGTQAQQQEPKTPPMHCADPNGFSNSDNTPVSTGSPKSPSRYAHNPYSVIVSPLVRPCTPDAVSFGTLQRVDSGRVGLVDFSLSGNRQHGY